MKTLIITVLLSLTILSTSYTQNSFEVYVNSRGTHSIKKYDEEGNYLGDFISSGSGGLTNPEDILFHPNGNIIVTGFSNQFIKEYDGITGDYLGNFSSGYNLAGPSKMSIGPDSLIYVTQWGETQNKVVRFNLEGEFIDEFTNTGAPKGLGHIWDENKNLYVALFGTGGSGTVHMFDSLGNDMGTFINSSVLQGPTSIWRNVIGEWFVEDWLTGDVLRYGTMGQYIDKFAEGMTNPEGIAFMPDGKMLVGDWGEDAVHLIDTDGSLLGYFCSGNGLVDPNSVKLKSITSTGVVNQNHISFEVTPTVGKVFKVSFTETENIKGDITIINSNGRIIDNILPRPQVMLNTENYPVGLYTIIYTYGTQKHSRKIIVSH